MVQGAAVSTRSEEARGREAVCACGCRESVVVFADGSYRLPACGTLLDGAVVERVERAWAAR